MYRGAPSFGTLTARDRCPAPSPPCGARNGLRGGRPPACAQEAAPPGPPGGDGTDLPRPSRRRRHTAPPRRQLPLRLGPRRPGPPPAHRDRHGGPALPQEPSTLAASTPHARPRERVDEQRRRCCPSFVNPKLPRRKGLTKLVCRAARVGPDGPMGEAGAGLSADPSPLWRHSLTSLVPEMLGPSARRTSHSAEVVVPYDRRDPIDDPHGNASESPRLGASPRRQP